MTGQSRGIKGATDGPHLYLFLALTYKLKNPEVTGSGFKEID